MKSKFNFLALIVLIGGLILSACGGGAAPAPASKSDLAGGAGAPSVYEAPAATEAPVMEAPAVVPQAVSGAAAKGPAVAGDANVVMATAVPPADATPGAGAPQAARMIIKNADIKLQVEDTDVAIDRATQIVGDAGGYIVSSRVWYKKYEDGNNYKYATVTIGVPVAEFEHTLSKLRGLAVKVLDESASGEDVSKQFVDLQSQLDNLQATRDRIKTFLDQAKTVDEALQINQQLSDVEAQIEQIKGQMNYLKDRSSYSTITINLEPKLPEIPTPTLIPTSTPTQTPTPEPWKPGETFHNATSALTIAYQSIIELLIWFLIVIVPIFAPPMFIGWLLWKFFARKPKQ